MDFLKNLKINYLQLDSFIFADFELISKLLCVLHSNVNK